MFGWLFGKRKVKGIKVEFLPPSPMVLTKNDLDEIALQQKEAERIKRLQKMIEDTKPISRSMNASSYQEERKRYESQNNPSKQEEVRRNYSTSNNEENKTVRRERDTIDDITDIAIGCALGGLFSDSSSSGDSYSSSSGSEDSDWKSGGGSFSGGGSSGDW